MQDAVDDWLLLLYDVLDAAQGGFPSVVPSDVDARFGDLARDYSQTDAQNRESMRAGFPERYAGALLSIGDRQLAWALSCHETSHLDHALVAHSIEDFRWDPRENILRLVGVWNGYKELGLDPRGPFLACSALSSVRGMGGFVDFVEQHDWVKAPHKKTGARGPRGRRHRC